MQQATTFKRLCTVMGFCLFTSATVWSQTDVDGIMMSKNNFCTGFQYSYSQWDHYWEGTLKRDNENLGTVSTHMIGWMGSYGITNKINALFSIPYVKTKASAGTLHSMKGMQDLSLMVKWKALEKTLGPGKFSLIAVGGLSFPVNNYTPDYLPLSIGLRSKTASIRVMGDYQVGKFFVTGSGAFVYRDNIKIDRTAYYTTEMHLTNEVEMPNAATFHFRAGYRGNWIGAEAVVNNWTTLGGFDITRNNMPFPSNKMNATTAGIALKCNPRALPGFSATAGGNYTIAGRNVGQALTLTGGVFYVFDFNRKKTTAKPN